MSAWAAIALACGLVLIAEALLLIPDKLPWNRRKRKK